MSDDFLATTLTTGQVSVGGSARGTIETENDVDWFAVELEADRTYRINLFGWSTGRGTLVNPLLDGIYDADGEFLAGTENDNGGRGTDARVFFTASEAGTYYVAAGVSGPWTGTYQVAVTDITHTFTDDFAAGTGTTGIVEADGSTMGEIDQKGDRDWFAVDLVAGREYQIDLQGVWRGHGTLRDPYLYGVHNAAGELLAGTTNDDGGAFYDSRLRFTAAESGTHYVAAGAYEASRGTYRLKVKLVDDYPETTQTAGRARVGDSTQGKVGYAGDIDWFAVRLEPGRTYLIDLEGMDTGAGTLADPYLRGIHDAGGNLIADTTDDDGGMDSNSRVTFTAEAGGTYYVAAGASGNGAGTYRLSVEDITHIFNDDYPAGVETTGIVGTGEISPGQHLETTAEGVISYEGDVDWIRFQGVTSGQYYQIDIYGHASERGGPFNPRLLGIYDTNGNRTEDSTDDDSGAGLNSRLTWQGLDVTYYIAVGGGQGRSEGAYTVRVAQVGGADVPYDDVRDPPHHAALQTDALSSLMREIDFPGDRDHFQMELVSGALYRIDLEGTGRAPLPDPYLYGIYTGDDVSGSPLAGTTDDNGGAGRNSRLFYEAEQGGTHTLVVGGAFRRDEGSYKVTLREVNREDLEDNFIDDYHSAIEEGILHGVDVGIPASGDIQIAGDRDWFLVILQPGKAYRIDLRGHDTGHGTLADPVLYAIWNSLSDTLIPGLTNDDGGVRRNSALQFTAQVVPEFSGQSTHVIEVGGRLDGTGTYTLSVTEVPDDFAAGTGTTGVVEVGGSARGELEFRHDIDWFAVELEADTGYRFDLEGRATRGGTLRDPYIHGIHDEQGDILYTVRSQFYFESAFPRLFDPPTGYVDEVTGYGIYESTADDDGGTGYNSRAYFGAAEAGTYYVAAGAYGGLRGSYRLTAREDPDDFAADVDTIGTVEVGGSARGRVEIPGDRDWFAVELEANTVYFFMLAYDAGRPNGLSDPTLYGIYDQNGAVAAALSQATGVVNVDGAYVKFRELRLETESWMQFTPTEAGTYFVAAGGTDGGDRVERHTPIGGYKLLVRIPADDYSQTAQTTGQVAVDGPARRGSVDYTGDIDWFKVRLDANTEYQIDVKASFITPLSLAVDPYLSGIHDANGEFIAGTTDDNGGGLDDARKKFTPDETGDYYVAVGSSPLIANAIAAIGLYTLSVEEVM